MLLAAVANCQRLLESGVETKVPKLAIIRPFAPSPPAPNYNYVSQNGLVLDKCE